jgi:hypothetical protein
MNAVFLDPSIGDETRRERLYSGQLFMYSVRPSALAFCQFAREMIAQAFHPLDPQEAQHQVTVEEYGALLATLKPQFINHPESKHHLQRLLVEFGCDPEKTYFDVPRLRTMAHGDYMKAGLAYAFHPHRDTWFSAPMCQLNWWLPVYDIHSENCMAFHPRYWGEPVANSSAEYNYEEWKRHGRTAAAQQVKAETRKQPEATEAVELDPQLRVVSEVGGILIFSAAQLHSTVPNTAGQTRFSIDFRTVHRGDLEHGRGAPKVDVHCTGTSMRDFLHCDDLSRLPAEVIARYDDNSALEFRESLIYAAESKPGV